MTFLTTVGRRLGLGLGRGLGLGLGRGLGLGLGRGLGLGLGLGRDPPQYLARQICLPPTRRQHRFAGAFLTTLPTRDAVFFHLCLPYDAESSISSSDISSPFSKGSLIALASVVSTRPCTTNEIANNANRASSTRVTFILGMYYNPMGRVYPAEVVVDVR